MRRLRIFGVLIILSSIILLTFNFSLMDCSENEMPFICQEAGPFTTKDNLLSKNEPYENETLLHHNMEVKIRTDNSLKVTSNFVLMYSDIQPLSSYLFIVNKTIKSVFVFDPIGPLEFSWEIKGDSSIINITMRYPLLQEQIYVFSISYEMDEVVYYVPEPSDYFGLDFVVRHKRQTDNFKLEMVLPVNHNLIEGQTPRPVSPSADKIYTEDNNVKISWKLEDLDVNDLFSYAVRYFKIGTFITDPPAINRIPIYTLLAFLAGVALCSLVFYFVIKKKYGPVKAELVSSLLSQSEQDVINAINEEGGMAIQRKICEKTGFSKSKVSQVLLKLEEKNILIRERWGRTNRVKITNPNFLNLELAESEEDSSDSKSVNDLD
ncbi:MAG: hypothetical protein HZR80_00270 [Candidatus Heimdallarchaeota archaeon]